MWQTVLDRSVLARPAFPVAAQPSPIAQVRLRVSLQDGRPTALEYLPRGAAGHPGLPLPTTGSLDGWPGGLPVSVPVDPSTRALSAAAGSLAGMGRRLELRLPATASAAAAETLVLLSDLRDRGTGLVLDCSKALPPDAALLARLPLTGLIVDAGLLDRCRLDRGVAMRFRDALQAAAALELTVVAAGVDTEARRAILCGLGCTQGHGTLFADAEPDAPRPHLLH